MKRIVILVLIFIFSVISLAAMGAGKSKGKGSKKIIYRYKKYQKFDFDKFAVEGETGAPEGIDIIRRGLIKYPNRLPYRKNFNVEIRKGMERVR